MVEHSIHNAAVVGSIPTPGTEISCPLTMNFQKTFTFKSHKINSASSQILFDYNVLLGDKSIDFTEKLTFPNADFSSIPQELLKSLLNNLSLILGISYWKLYCPGEIKIKENFLTKEQAQFWNTVYTKGLGEFFYRNKIDFRGLVNSPYHSNDTYHHSDFSRKDRSLLMLGGGKDSIVSAELLKEKGKDFTAFVVNDHPLQKEIIKLLGVNSIIIKREIDPKLLILNKQQGTYNGHVPVSAIYAFIAFLAGALYDYRQVISSNEKSANYGNLEYLGETVNHQWSKSLEFENLFSEYIKKYITPSISYFSILRPLYEIKITQLFANYPKYFSAFSSCNRNFTIVKTSDKKWCGQCPKCAFIFATLAAFLAKEEVVNIFGKNLFADPSLIDTYKELLGVKDIKPFDCVGTPDEVKLAFYLAHKRGEFNKDIIMQMFEKEVLPKFKNAEQLEKELLSEEVKKILILGFGMEGRATFKFLKQYFPNQSISIADKKDGADYLDKQKHFDLIIKSPGIPKKLLTRPYTTATNIFFANVKGTTIGVTGSKGKSTTSSLIYAMLKQGGKKAHLVGNIGNPMLSALLRSNEEDDVWVCELSSFQLDDIKYSPHVSVIINLFKGHTDYHGTIEEYFAAKKNIVAKAKSSDYFIYNPDFKELRQLAKTTKAKAIPFTAKLSFDEKIIPLLGKHNRDNVRAAVTAVNIFAIPQQKIITAVKNFQPLPHRLELVGTFKGITFYDDAIATIPEATVKAIETLKNIGTILLGGQDRDYDYSELVNTIIKNQIPNIVLFPDSGEKILKVLKKKTKKMPTIFTTKDMEEGVVFSYKHTPSGTICLLSSAAPSFSLWRNFEEKGDLFQKFVKQYGK